jgi:hypothetical protein
MQKANFSEAKLKLCPPDILSSINYDTPFMSSPFPTKYEFLAAASCGPPQ